VSEGRAKKSIFRRWWFWLAAVMILILIFGGLGDSDKGTPGPDAQNPPAADNAGDAANDAVPEEPAERSPGTAEDDGTKDTADASVKEGMYKIGSDLPAGEYILFSESGFPAYYQLTSDSTGSLESIISNDNFNGTRYITTSEGQYLEFRNAVGYPAGDAPSLRPDDGRYDEGMYKVGKDIDPGEYKLIPDKNSVSSYVEVSKDSKGILDSIISNDNFETEKYITISEGQYIKLVSCHIIV
jgi:hypothetical protein